MPHRGIKFASAACRSNALSTELHPQPTFSEQVTTDFTQCHTLKAWCVVLFQKSSPNAGDGPHDIGLPGCLFYRIPHKVGKSGIADVAGSVRPLAVVVLTQVWLKILGAICC